MSGRTFGSETRARGAAGSRGSTLIDSLTQDVRYAVRSLASTPGFTVVALACLAIGISANTTMFGVADRLFLRPPPGIQDPGRVVRLYLDRSQGSIRTPGGGPVSFPDYQDLEGYAVSHPGAAFTGVAAYSDQQIGYGTGADVRQLSGQAVTGRYFDVLGTRPALGRFFVREEDSLPGTHPVAVLSYNFWQREFAGSPSVLGRAITLDGNPFTVIGVAERGFSGFDLQSLDLWIPMREMRAELGPGMFQERHAIWLPLVARLAPGVPPSVAEARASTAKRLDDAAVAPDLDKNVRVTTGPLLEAAGPKRDAPATIALWLLAAVAFVLLIACANVANLLLARGTRRRREIAIRLSLGARRGQLVRQLVVESLVLAAAGGAAGCLISLWAGGAVRVLALPAAASAALDLRTLAFTAAVSVVTALAFGVMPAVLTTRADLTSSLKEGTRHAGGGRSGLQFGLLVAQAALSLIVLAGAGLFVRSLRNVRAIDLGVDADHIVVATVDLQRTSYDSVARRELYQRAVERLSAEPGVRAVSYEGVPPFRGVMGLRTRLPGRDSADQDQRSTYANFVGPGFLAANGTPLRRGRDITDEDRANTLPVAVVNETMARRLWPGKDPIGQCMLVSMGPPGASRAPSPCRYVVGVMGDGKYVSMTEDPLALFLLPFSQATMGLPPSLIVRGRGDPHVLASTVRQALAGLTPDRALIDVRVLADQLDPQLQPYRIGAVLFTTFGLVALVLAAIGLYGVVSYLVAQRTQEAGVRLALGARGIDVLALMLRRGMTPALLGGVVGMVGAVMVTRLLRNQLYGVSPTDPLTLAAVAALLALVAALACYLPARRAARVDPVIALRSE